MSKPILPSGATFLADFKDLKRRLDDLERAARLPNTSQRGGTFELRNDTGDPVFRFGTFARGDATPAYGIQALIPNGPDPSPSVIEVDDDGLEAPWLDVGFAKAGDFVAVTSSGFVDTWVGNAALVVARAVKVGYVIGVDAATTGEVRIVAGDRTSSTVALPAGVIATGAFNMLLEDDTLGSGPLGIRLQARRVTGAGAVNVYPPAPMAQVGNDGTNATTTGL